MKLKITITYKGKNYKTLMDAAQKMIIDGMEEMIQKQLAPFEDEINSQGGIVEMHLDHEFKGELTIKNIDDDLGSRIRAALK